MACHVCGHIPAAAAAAVQQPPAAPIGPPIQHAIPPPARRGPVAPSNRYARPAHFNTPQCPPLFGYDDGLPEPAQQPDGTEVTCDCDDGLLGNTCVACDGGTLSDMLWAELEAAAADSGDLKACSGNVSVRASIQQAPASCVSELEPFSPCQCQCARMSMSIERRETIRVLPRGGATLGLPGTHASATLRGWDDQMHLPGR